MNTDQCSYPLPAVRHSGTDPHIKDVRRKEPMQRAMSRRRVSTVLSALAMLVAVSAFNSACQKEGPESDDTGNTINGHKYVEMGDGLKWATCNLGAKHPEDYGDYFAWGETSPKTDYTWASYKWMKSGQSTWNYITKYTIADGQTGGIWYDGDNFIGDNKTVLEASDDAARAQWGGSWRMPTIAEWEALRNEGNFTWSWTSDYNGTGVAGYTVTSKVSGFEGNRIFLPAAGYRYGTELYYAGSLVGCWSSSRHTVYSSLAYGMGFDSNGVSGDDAGRRDGLSVRPVSE